LRNFSHEFFSHFFCNFLENAMKKNMGTIDRVIRTGAALVIAGLYFAGAISGVTAIVLGVVAMIFIGTSLMGSCPLYLPFNISTRGKE
jgi:hypothetical protein